MHIEPPSASPPSRQSRAASARRSPHRHRARHLAGASLLALLVGATTAVSLGTVTYRATAIVQVPDAGFSTRLATVNGALVGAVSKPVMARAAASLVGAGVSVSPAGVGERLAMMIGAPGAAAPGPEDRLAGLLSSSVTVRPGAVPGTLEVSAAMSGAEQAALAATGVAEAFVAEQDVAAAQAHGREEAAAAARFEVLRNAAASAHAKLSALEDPVVTSAATPAAATNPSVPLAAAIARRDAIARIVASGSPPLGEGKGMPAAVDALQTIYLDQVKQLAKARETLGDRHTTVISLNEAVQRAAAALTAEWHRLEVAADVDVSDVRARQGSAHQGTPRTDVDARTDGIRQATLAEARGAARRADAALARAENAAADAVEAEPYRVIVRASAPQAASGVPPAARVPLDVLAGLAAAALFMRFARRAPRPAPAPVEASGEPLRAPVHVSTHAPLRVPVRVPAPAPAGEPPRAKLREEPVLEAVPTHSPKFPPIKPPLTKPSLTLDASVELAELQAAIADLTILPERTLDMPFHPPAPQPRDQDTLRQAMIDVLPGLAAIEPRPGALPTVMVAANEIGVTTMEAALALGHVAAGVGYRVLVIEGARPRADLATAADPDIDPILVDLAGGLRVALRAEGCAGVLFLAPCFKDGPRIASALARRGETPFVDELADEFDLIVIDGGRAADRAAAGWDIEGGGVDLAVRVARFASRRDDERFVATLDLTDDAFLGTVAGSTFVPKAAVSKAPVSKAAASNAVQVAPVAEAPAPEDRAAERARPPIAMPRAALGQQLPAQQLPRAYQPSHAQPAPSRVPHFTARRRVGLR